MEGLNPIAYPKSLVNHPFDRQQLRSSMQHCLVCSPKLQTALLTKTQAVSYFTQCLYSDGKSSDQSIVENFLQVAAVYHFTSIADLGETKLLKSALAELSSSTDINSPSANSPHNSRNCHPPSQPYLIQNLSSSLVVVS